MGMNPAKVQPDDYIDFLIATPVVCSAPEAARVQPHRPRPPAHDAFTRLHLRLEPDAEALWAEVRPLVQPARGVLVLDDTTLDKPYARHIDLVTHHWSGKHHAVVRGINLLTLLWSDGDTFYPCDYRLYDKAHDRQTKNDHFRELLRVARDRGFRPACVLFDSWYASLDNLKRVRDYGWTFLTRLKGNRQVNWERRGLRPLDEWALPAGGAVVHLAGFGLVKVFRIDARDGDTEYWATNALTLTEGLRLGYAEQSWGVEEYHRGLKQFCGVERCAMRTGRGQRNHIGLALRAFVRLAYHRWVTGVSWFTAKWAIIRSAVRQYLAEPLYRLPSTA